MSKEHEHNFVAEKYTVQVPHGKYLGSEKYHTAILQIEHVLVFCNTCGDSKKLTEVEPKA